MLYIRAALSHLKLNHYGELFMSASSLKNEATIDPTLQFELAKLRVELLERRHQHGVNLAIGDLGLLQRLTQP